MRHNLRNIIGTSLRGLPRRRLVAGLALTGSLAFAGFALSDGFSVGLGATGPTPTAVTVNWGGTVMFVNSDTIPHGITSSRPELQSPPIAPGQTFTTVLTGRTATYPYRETGQKNVNLKGNVVSNVTGSVSLKSTKDQILYGQRVSFSGSSTFTGTPVSFQQRVRGKHGWTQLQALTSGDDGSFSTTYKPALGAKYRTTVAGGQIASDIVSVTVKPTLTITPQGKKTKAGHRIKVYSKINPGNAASKVTLYQCNARRGSWTRVASKSPTRAGNVTFVWAASLGKNYLRTSVSRIDSAVGYVAPTSRNVLVTGVGKAPAVSKKRKNKPQVPRKSC